MFTMKAESLCELCTFGRFAPFFSRIVSQGAVRGLCAGLFTSAIAASAAADTRAAAADLTTDVVAVYSSVSPDYVRTRAPNGSFKLETYAFGEGGDQGGPQRDLSIDRMRFMDIAQTIAPALAAKNYVPCDTKHPRRTDLLIVVYWGTTVGTDSTSSSAQYQIAQVLTPAPLPQPIPAPTGWAQACKCDPNTSGIAEEAQARFALKIAGDSALQQSLLLTALANRDRDRQDRDNASILGYLPEMERVSTNQALPLGRARQDVIDEIEESRYYVVLLAYDFQLLLTHKQRKLLWETRFSIPQRRNDFSKQLARMAQSASAFFGQTSRGLERKAMPTGHVELGETKSLGTVDAAP